MIKAKHFIYYIFIASALFFSSCSDSYQNAIPAESSALISVDMKKMAASSSSKRLNLLAAVLHIKNVSDCGIDLTSKMYMFESQDGNLGLCAKVSDSDDLKEYLDKLSKKGVCTKTKERRGFNFSVLKDSWVLGFSDDALLVMGPVTPDAQAELQQSMVRYLKQSEDESVVSRPIYEKLDSIEAPMAIVAEAQALPEKFIAPFTLGAPKGADASQVLIAAKMFVSDGCLNIEGKTFSFNKEVNASLQNASKQYRPIKGNYVASMSRDATLGMFMNVDGTKFLPLMQNNQGLQALLAGINTAIDMDNILRSVNGDMSIVIPSYSDDKMQITWAAKLAHAKWLADVDYWKQSVPKGGKILDSGKNSYYYTDGNTSFFFGVSPDLQFYSGSDKVTALGAIKSNVHPLDAKLQKKIIGQKMVMIINLNDFGSNKGVMSALSVFMKPMFGDIRSIVYTLK